MGLDIEQTAEGIIVHQEHYIDEVEEIMLFDKRNRNSDKPLSMEESRELKKVAGQWSWVASQTRPDLSFDALELNIMKNKLTVSRANKAIRMLKRSKTDLVYPRLGSLNQFQLKVFSDASWGNLLDKVSSDRGHLVFLSVGENVCPLSWISNKVRRKVPSTLSTETLALNDALDDAVYLKHLISEIYHDDVRGSKISILAYIDNKSSDESLRSTKQVQEKRLRIDIAEVQRMLESKEINEINWIPSIKENLADGLTKRGIDDTSVLLQCISTGKLKF